MTRPTLESGVTDIANLIRSIGAIAWPLVIAVLLWRLFPILKGRFAAGDITLSIGGMEVSLQAASASVQKQIADLQDQLSALRATVPVEPGAEMKHLVALAPLDAERILWVDDHPENNAYEVSRLVAKGRFVRQVRSTNEALAALAHEHFDKVVTDMERGENGKVEPQAGLDLLEQMRVNDIAVPVFVYCSSQSVGRYQSKLLAAGAAGITASPVQLFEQLGIA